MSDALAAAEKVTDVKRSADADDLWHASYNHLRRDRRDGPTASILARSAPQVLRLSLAYALADTSSTIEERHLQAALAIWKYVEDSTVWMLGGEIENGEIESLLGFITQPDRRAGPALRSTSITSSGTSPRATSTRCSVSSCVTDVPASRSRR